MEWNSFSMQDMSTLRGENMENLHDVISCYLMFILLLVGVLLLFLISSKWLYIGWVEASMLEFVWTLFPMLILFLIGIPSVALLYSSEIESQSDLTIIVVGRQWYWSYNYSGLGVEFDSFMIPLSDLNLGDFRLLEVDNRTIIPWNSIIRMGVTSSDVLHSWALPAFGVKIDATPSRLSFIHFNSYLSGLFYGQCSEICGANHSFMPICMEVTSPTFFGMWLNLM